MTVEFWLIQGKERLRLPVNPESHSYRSTFNYTETEVEGLGEITTIGRRGLKEFSINTFWPARYNAAYCDYSGFIKPGSFIKKIEKWRNKREPIRYTVTGAASVNLLVTIRDFQVDANKSGSPGDIYFTLSLLEWREAKVEKVKVNKDGKAKKSSSRPKSSGSKQVKSYVVKKGDCLWNIAKKKEIYGDATKWPRIYNANRKVIGSNPNLIYPGQKLVIPR